MIPSTNNKLLITEDWTKIYQSFKNADFKSYDFDTLRRVMISYLRENYPEDFNDYVDSSEFIALIDLIAYLGQNLSFRIDLNARENFLETASRKDSVLRLAQLVSYNAKRNTPASGFLKVTAISTTDNVIDSNNINLANQIVGWNDPSNSSWYQQFITILNSAMPAGEAFGQPADSAVIDAVQTEQYTINSSNTGVPVYQFSKLINGTNMNFEIVSSAFREKNYVYEETPYPGRPLSMIWKSDNQGAGSNNTGFFLHFKQGTLSSSNFTIDRPVANEIVGINVTDINNTDVWLWQLGASGGYTTEWTKVDSTVGNNVIYNSLNKNNRTIYAISSRVNDQIDLNFADGSFGDLPKGSFQLFYRQSNGLTYTIPPESMNGIFIKVPYINKLGQQHTLSLSMSLQYSVANSSAAESIDQIKQKAPQNYYIQNRMVTGEDYNVGPVAVGANILKVKSINRQSSGISKYFDLKDVTGKYSQVDIYAQDGMIYKEDTQKTFAFTFNNRNEAFGVLKTQVEPIISNPATRNFYIDKFPRPDLLNIDLEWILGQTESTQVRGYFKDIANNSPVAIGSFSSNNSQYISQGALVKFKPPVGYFFTADGKLTTQADASTRTYLWTKVANVTGDGCNSGLGLLNNGTGPVVLTGFVPEGAIAVEVIPALVTTLSFALESEIVNQMVAKHNFGLAFDAQSRLWYIVVDTNIDLNTGFNLIYQGNTDNINIDSSWQIAFQWTGKNYVCYYRQTNYVFESEAQTGFFIDDRKQNFDYVTNTVIKDQITVLGVNTAPNLGNSWHNGTTDPVTATVANNGDFYINTLTNQVFRKLLDRWVSIDLGQTINELGKDFFWQIDDVVVETDGYVNPKKVLVSFYDPRNDGGIADPDSFERITDSKSPTVQSQGQFLGNYVFFQYSSDGSRYTLVPATEFISVPDESYVTTEQKIEYITAGVKQKFYFYQSNIIKTWSVANADFVLEPSYFAYAGRSGLKFHYTHNSAESNRIDPAKTNIIDLYILTTGYDTAYRQWLAGSLASEPLPPTTSTLEDTYSQSLEPIKSISDSLVYHSATYTVLFGDKAPANLKATFRAVKNPNRPVSDNDIKTRIIYAINSFFALDNWDFGQSFHFSELSTYVMNLLTPDITNFIVVPNNGSSFGSLFGVASQSNEIFVSGATVNDIEIISAVTPSQLTSTGLVA